MVTNVDSNDNLTFSIKDSFIDSTPTVNSTNLVTSGGVKSALDINTTDIAAAVVRIANNETNISNHTNAIQALDGRVSTNTTDIDSLETTVGTLSTNVNTNTTNIGTLSNLTTTNKTSLVNAVNEINIPSKLVSVGAEAPTDGRRVWFKKGKNLINYEDFTGTITNYYFVTLPSTNFGLEAGKTYTLSLDIVSSVTPFAISVGAGTTSYAVDIKQVGDNQNGRNSITFTPTESQLANGNILFFRAPRYVTSQSSASFTITNVQLEEGSTATTYEPFVEQQGIYVDNELWYDTSFIKSKYYSSITTSDTGYYNLGLMSNEVAVIGIKHNPVESATKIELYSNQLGQIFIRVSVGSVYSARTITNLTVYYI